MTRTVEKSRRAPPLLWKFLTFTQNLGLSRLTGGAFSQAWSLSVEEQFYIVLPILVLGIFQRVNFRRVMTFIASIFLAGVLIRLGLWIFMLAPAQGKVSDFSNLYDMYIYYPTYSRLDGLLVENSWS